MYKRVLEELELNINLGEVYIPGIKSMKSCPQGMRCSQ